MIKKNPWLVVGGMVVVVVALVSGAFLLGRSTSGDGAEPGDEGSTATEVTLDEVVPGQGARSQSVNVPSVGISYPATCVGAAQAAAGWTQQVFAGLNEQTAAVPPETLEALISQEILAPTYTPMPDETDPAETVPEVAEQYATGERNPSTPFNEVHFEYGAFRLLTCTEGVKAIVEIHAPLMTNGWRSNSPQLRIPSEQPIVYRYQLVAVSDEWRAETVQDLTAAQNFSHDHSLDYLKPWGDARRTAGTLMTADIQKVLINCLGVSGRSFKEE